MHDPRHLWDFQWVRDLALLLGMGLIIALAYSIREVVTPVLIGLALAYAVNPLVHWAERRKYSPRWASTTLILVIGLGSLAGLAIYLIPKLATQITDLVDKAPEYYQNTRLWLQAHGVNVNSVGHTSDEPEPTIHPFFNQQPEPSPATTPAVPPDYLDTVMGLAIRSLGVGLNLVNLVLYLFLACLTIGFCFFYFSWRFDAIMIWFDQFIPQAHRWHIRVILGKMNRTISAFIRGRLIQALAMSIILCIGWAIVGVPYWLLLGIASGILHLIPYGGGVGWALAVIVAVVDRYSTGAGSVLWFAIWPSFVYLVAQFVDSWILEPMVQASATELHPVTILVAVIAGGAMAGLFGLILAIPVTACLKILSDELLLPRIRKALGRDAPPSEGAPP